MKMGEQTAQNVKVKALELKDLPTKATWGKTESIHQGGELDEDRRQGMVVQISHLCQV